MRLTFHFWIGLGLNLILCLGIGSASAQTVDFPKKPIKIVVTFPPGGSADAIVRMLSPQLTEKLGQALVVENRPGAGGNIGMTAVAKALPDGHTLGIGAAGALSVDFARAPALLRGCRRRRGLSRRA